METSAVPWASASAADYSCALQRALVEAWQAVVPACRWALVVASFWEAAEAWYWVVAPVQGAAWS